MALYVHQILSVLRDGRQALNFLSFLGCKLAVAGWKLARSRRRTLWTALSRRKESTSWQTGSRWLLSHSLFFNVVCVAGRLVFSSLFLDLVAGLKKRWRSKKKTCWGLKQDKPSARSGKRHFAVEKKSSPLQALPQAARTLRCTSNSVRLWSFKATLQEIWPCVEAPRSSK